MDGDSKDVRIAIPPVSIDAMVSSSSGGDEKQSYRRGDTFGPSGMPITIQVTIKHLYESTTHCQEPSAATLALKVPAPAAFKQYSLLVVLCWP